MKIILTQSLLAVLMIISLVFLNFKDYEMFMNMNMSTQASSYIFFISAIILFSLFLFEEKGDERIEHHKNLADRLSLFLILLISGVFIFKNYLSHMIDFQILSIFVVALFSKLILRIYFYFKK